VTLLISLLAKSQGRARSRMFRQDPRACVKGPSLSWRPNGHVAGFRLVYHPPGRPRRLQAALTGAAEQGACLTAASGTFQQLEDSSARTRRGKPLFLVTCALLRKHLRSSAWSPACKVR
jgi:hypothetical protein